MRNAAAVAWRSNSCDHARNAVFWFALTRSATESDRGMPRENAAARCAVRTVDKQCNHAKKALFQLVLIRSAAESDRAITHRHRIVSRETILRRVMLPLPSAARHLALRHVIPPRTCSVALHVPQAAISRAACDCAHFLLLCTCAGCNRLFCNRLRMLSRQPNLPRSHLRLVLPCSLKRFGTRMMYSTASSSSRFSCRTSIPALEMVSTARSIVL